MPLSDNRLNPNIPHDMCDCHHNYLPDKYLAATGKMLTDAKCLATDPKNRLENGRHVFISQSIPAHISPRPVGTAKHSGSPDMRNLICPSEIDMAI